MATTSIWKIKTRLDSSIKYIINPEKTLNKELAKEHYYLLEKPINSDYNFINEKVEFISGLNLDERDPYNDMMDTKKIYDKTDGIIGFHAYQSFKEGEVTPDVAHEIGVKLAQEMWSDYEVIVATHQNTNHIHNHFIINSVSFKTGIKYNNNKTNYAKLRNISDSLCMEYGLSTLNEEDKYKKCFDKNILNDDYYKILKEDIDSAISESLTIQQFLNRLKLQGYNCYMKYDKITVYKDNYDKVRIEKLFGKNYSKENILNRLFKSKYRKYAPLTNNQIYNNYLKTNKGHKGIYGLYLYYCYLLKVFPIEQPKQYLPYSIRKDIKKLDTISEETKFLEKNKIETIEELLLIKETNDSKLDELVGNREYMWIKYHRAKIESEKIEIYNDISKITEEIKECRKIKKYCEDIEIRSYSMIENIKEIDKVNIRDNEKDIVR